MRSISSKRPFLAGFSITCLRWETRAKFGSVVNSLEEVDHASLQVVPGENFKKWGLSLEVCFREGGQMEVLRKNFQSGGERSVSTIMYLMALQDQVTVFVALGHRARLIFHQMISPFRVVDEINQGMDERNERIVFRRIVLNSIGDKSPQYFLITPKLLQGLTMMEQRDVTILTVFNGPFNLRDHTLWDLPKFVKTPGAAGHMGGESTDEDVNAKRRRLLTSGI